MTTSLPSSNGRCSITSSLKTMSLDLWDTLVCADSLNALKVGPKLKFATVSDSLSQSTFWSLVVLLPPKPTYLLQKLTPKSFCTSLSNSLSTTNVSHSSI